jgi:hypothetical protein
MIEFINVLFNLTHLILLAFIIRLHNQEKTRADRLEQLYHKLYSKVDNHLDQHRKTRP